MCVGLAIGLFATEILIILTRPAYLPAAPYVGFLAYVHVFGGFGVDVVHWRHDGQAIALDERIGGDWRRSQSGTESSVDSTVGLWGATASTVISYGIIQAILYFWLRRRYPIPYPMGRMVSSLGLTLGILCVSLWLPPLYFPLRIAVKLGLFLVFPMSLLILQLIEWREVKYAAVLIKDRFLTRLPART